MQPTVFTHDTRDSALSYMDATLSERNPHPPDTIVIVERRSIKDLPHSCRKNFVLAWLVQILQESVVSDLAYFKDNSLDAHRPPVTVFVDEPETIPRSYFFRFVAKNMK